MYIITQPNIQKTDEHLIKSWSFKICLTMFQMQQNCAPGIRFRFVRAPASAGSAHQLALGQAVSSSYSNPKTN